jgi:hypothetical protein
MNLSIGLLPHLLQHPGQGAGRSASFTRVPRAGVDRCEYTCLQAFSYKYEQQRKDIVFMLFHDSISNAYRGWCIRPSIKGLVDVSPHEGKGFP